MTMKRVERFIQKLYDSQICNDFDRIIPVIGDEGMGKSTFILEFMGRYERYRGADSSPESILDKVVFDNRESFRQAILQADQGDPIAAMDAAHIMHKKEAMNPDQIETEKSLLDIRIDNYVILLGYQDWDDIPTVLQKRRAKNAFRITSRGRVVGYNRSSLDEKFESRGAEKWPRPDLQDRFYSLEGTDIWDDFQEMDAEHKRQRLVGDNAENGNERDGPSPQDVLDGILESGVGEYIDENEFNNRRYISKPLIKLDYPELSDQEAEQVKHGLRREVDIEADDIESESTPPPSA